MISPIASNPSAKPMVKDIIQTIWRSPQKSEKNGACATLITFLCIYIMIQLLIIYSCVIFSSRFSLHTKQDGWYSLGEHYLVFYFHSVLIKQNLDTVLYALESMGTIKIFLQERLSEYFPNVGEKIFFLFFTAG